MDIFDDTIAEIRNWFEDKRKTDQARIFEVLGAKNHDALLHEAPVTDRGSAGIILKEDTHIELGHPSVGSCCAALATYDADLVCDGRITLVGPDVLETREERLPFSQIIIAGIKGQSAGEVSDQATVIIDRTASAMDRIAHGAAQVEGYMIRSVPNLIWARVSQHAASKALSQQMPGERLILALKQNCENIVRCEICFATSAKADIETLDTIIDGARAKTRKLEKFSLGADGEYECTQEQDCGTCSEQVVCDNIRDVIKIRKGDRVISFGKEEVTDSAR